ncbi:MAG: hypothetical protein ACO26U_14795, partial [Burkholderiaceae bacterium]
IDVIALLELSEPCIRLYCGHMVTCAQKGLPSIESVKTKGLLMLMAIERWGSMGMIGHCFSKRFWISWKFTDIQRPAVNQA